MYKWLMMTVTFTFRSCRDVRSCSLAVDLYEWHQPIIHQMSWGHFVYIIRGCVAGCWDYKYVHNVNEWSLLEMSAMLFYCFFCCKSSFEWLALTSGYNQMFHCWKSYSRRRVKLSCPPGFTLQNDLPVFQVWSCNWCLQWCLSNYSQTECWRHAQMMLT